MATADALERRARRRNRRKLTLEAIAVLGATAVAVVIVYFVFRHSVGSPWRVAGTDVQDISNTVGIQTEVAAAVDPARRGVLFGAANESLEPEIRIFSTTNAGRTWSTGAGPQYNPNTCAWGDPSVAISPSGRQYVAFTEKSICIMGPDLTPYLVVASRPGPKGAWTVRRVTHPAVKYGFDDRPSIAVGADGRAYVAWSRLLGRARQSTVISSSRDGGRSWSAPLEVDAKLEQPQLVALAAGAPGFVYIAGVDASLGLWIGRSTDGGRHFAIRSAAPLPGSRAASCIVFGKFVLPQQSVRCLGPNPSLSLAPGRVYLTYGVNGPDLTQDVAVAVFDPALHPVARGLVAPSKKKADQFWPTSTVDAQTGRLWVCYYDTTGDSRRQHAWFTCTSSRDGRNWAIPVRAASPSESPDVLWNDAEIAGYGDSGGYGGSVAVAAAKGTAYPLWIDTRNIGGNQEEVFAARIPASAQAPR
jgi:hypothetical protein